MFIFQLVYQLFQLNLSLPHRLRCKKSLSDTNIGVQLKKVSRTNICQSCGNPWSTGNYDLEVKKKFKTARIKRLLHKKTSRKLNQFEQNMLDQHSKQPSSLVVACKACSKMTTIPTALPPKEEKRQLKPPPEMSKTQLKKALKRAKASIPDGQQKIPQNPLLSNPAAIKAVKAQSNKPTFQPPKKSLSTIKKQAEKPKFSKSQLKNITKGLNKSKPSALQAFLNSVK